MKKKAMSVIRIVIVIMMILVIAVALVTDILFSRSETPKIFGAGTVTAAAAGGQAQDHGSGQGQCKSFLHNDSPFLCKLYRVFPVDSISHV